jgi:4-amino-4-deoxy-L-arabinose transferase-like glycosyltransferase
MFPTSYDTRGSDSASTGWPRSIVACLPLLWRKVLFPGNVQNGPRTSLPGWLLVIAFPAILLYPTLGFELFEPDEGRYAEIPREMLKRGEWVVPYLQAEPYLDKPPLMYWLVILSYKLFGVHDWSARLVPALALHACIVITYLLGRRSLGEVAARWGSLLLCLAPGFMCMGRLLLLDGLLTCLVTLAIVSAFEACRREQLSWSWWLLSALACGLGVLTKGPIAVLLLVPPLWLHRKLAGTSWRLTWRQIVAFGGILLAVTLPWYLAVCLRSPAFARYFLWEHNVMRFLAPFDHPRPVWFYLPVLAAGMLPAVLWCVAFLRFLSSSDPSFAARRCPELGFMLITGIWCIFFFSLSGCKLPTYILPAFPFFSLAIGYYLAVVPSNRPLRRLAVLGSAFALILVAQHMILPWYAWYRSPMQRPELVGQYAADSDAVVVCYPRDCETAAFYLSRDDLQEYRSKDIEALRAKLRAHPRTVVLLTHRHSLRGLRELLPPELEIVEEAHLGLADLKGAPDWLSKHFKQLAGETALGLCDIAVVEKRRD